MARFAKSKNYILITDADAVINVRDVNPHKLQDATMVVSQLMYLKKYRKNIDHVVKVFEEYISRDIKKPVTKK